MIIYPTWVKLSFGLRGSSFASLLLGVVVDSRPGRLGAGTTGSRGRREGVAMAIESRPGRLEAETTGSRNKEEAWRWQSSRLFGFKSFFLKWAKASFIGSRLIWLIWFWSWFDTDCFLILVYWLFYQLFGPRAEMDSKRLKNFSRFSKFSSGVVKLFEVKAWESF